MQNLGQALFQHPKAIGSSSVCDKCPQQFETSNEYIYNLWNFVIIL